jgi:hypothetical protein
VFRIQRSETERVGIAPSPVNQPSRQRDRAALIFHKTHYRTPADDLRHRRETLSFGHHAEVASLPQEEADGLLDWCEENAEANGRPRTRSELRDKVKIARPRPLLTVEYRGPLLPRSEPGTPPRLIYPFEPRAQPAKPEVELDRSPGGGPVPEELRDLRPEPPVQPDHVAIAWAAIAKLSPDEVEKWVATASSKELEELRATLEALLARLRR